MTQLEIIVELWFYQYFYSFWHHSRLVKAALLEKEKQKSRKTTRLNLDIPAAAIIGLLSKIFVLKRYTTSLK